MKENQNHMDVNDLWNYFKNSTSDSIKKNIPTKSIGNKTTLPWVTPQIKKLINKKNKLFKKDFVGMFFFMESEVEFLK
jgi:hypothetical protein